MNRTGAPASLAGRRRYRRVVLALDTSGADAATLERGAALAARLRGELVGLFVEDIDLLRLAEHPGICTVSPLAAQGQELAADHLKTMLRLHTQRLRRAMEQAAARRQVKCAFQVCQGRLLAEVLGAAGDDDLVVIGWSATAYGAPWAASPPPIAVAQALAEARVRSVLLLHPRSCDGPVLVAFDGSEAAWHGLATAAQVADLDGGSLDVALLASRLDEAEAWRADIEAALADSRLTVSLLHTPKAGLATLCESATARRSTLLVLASAHALAEGETSRRLLQRTLCSVLLVR